MTGDKAWMRREPIDMGWDAVGSDGIGWDLTGLDQIGSDGMRLDWIGLDGIGWDAAGRLGPEEVKSLIPVEKEIGDPSL